MARADTIVEAGAHFDILQKQGQPLLALFILDMFTRYWHEYSDVRCSNMHPDSDNDRGMNRKHYIHELTHCKILALSSENYTLDFRRLIKYDTAGSSRVVPK